MATYVIDNDVDAATDPAVVGGKAASLARLVPIDVGVPDYFVVAVSAYEAFMAQDAATQAMKRLVSALAALDIRDHGLLEQAQEARARLIDVEVPEPVAAAIQARYSKLLHDHGSPTLVAVRSSATAEDGADASYAGQYDSFLEVQGAADVIATVRSCWISLWTDRAIAYRARHGIDAGAARMAVVVQAMVPAAAAGVMFTVNPVNAEKSEVVINAVKGDARRLVAGTDTPAEWVVAKTRGDVLRDSGMGSSSDAPALTVDELSRLLDIGLRIEAHFGAPQDVEWAMADGQIHVVQARPVTALAPPDASPTPQFSADRGYWTRFGLGEWLQQPVTPLFGSLCLPVFSEETDDLMRSEIGLRRPDPSWTLIHDYYYVRADVRSPLWLGLRAPARLARSVRTASRRWQEAILPAFLAEMDELQRFAPREQSADKLVEHLDKVVKSAAGMWAWIVLTGMYARALEWLAHRVVVGGGAGDHAALRGGYGSQSQAADEALRALAREALEHPTIIHGLLELQPDETMAVLERDRAGQAWIAHFRTWLREWGHRVFDLDIVNPTIGEQPDIVLGTIRRYVEQGAVQWAGTDALGGRNAITASNIRGRPRLAGVSRRFSRLVQMYTSVREDRPSYLQLAWPIMRRDVLEIGRRLTATGLLERESDVFYLTTEELRRAVNEKPVNQHATWSLSARATQELVRARRKTRHAEQRYSPPEHVNAPILARLVFDPPGRTRLRRRGALKQQEGVIAGSPGSRGVVRGRVRVVRAPEELGSVRRGDIVAAPYTTPAWTSALALAGGIITERGGGLSHAAIVAREYGIPAVLGVKDLFSHVTSDVLVEIDGSLGTVHILQGPPRS